MSAPAILCLLLTLTLIFVMLAPRDGLHRQLVNADPAAQDVASRSRGSDAMVRVFLSTFWFRDLHSLVIVSSCTSFRPLNFLLPSRLHYLLYSLGDCTSGRGTPGNLLLGAPSVLSTVTVALYCCLIAAPVTSASPYSTSCTF